MEWMLLPLRRYAEFTGRSRRKEYWMFVLGYVLVALVFVVLGAMMGGFADDGSLIGNIPLILLGLFALAIFIPSLAVQVRRLHDQNRTGWLVLIGFIPYIGGLILFVFMCLPGTVGPNRYGPDPKNPVDTDIFA